MSCKLKLFITVVLSLTLMVSLVGCAEDSTPAEPEDTTFTVTDQKDREITFESTPTTLVSLAPNITEIVFSLDLADEVVAVTDNSSYPEAAKEKERIGNFFEPNVEKIVALEPDVVFASALIIEPVQQLENAGVKVVVIDPLNIEGIYEALRLVGEVMDVEDKAEEVVSGLQSKLEVVHEQVNGLSEDERPMVYYEVWHEGFITAGPGTFINSIIEMAGGRNVASDAEAAYPNYSEEVLLQKNPDFIILGHEGQTVEQTLARAGWEDTSAVQQENVYAVNPDIFNQPSPRIVQAVEQLAKLLHPELFK